MKTLQNNFTTPEQSKRLLELGIPADSADCYFDSTKLLRPTIINQQIERELIHTRQQYPCWSVGRLIEIQEKCTGTRFFRTLHPDLLGDIIGQIEYTVGTVGMDFSKLEY